MKKYLSTLVVIGVLLSGCGAGKVYNVSKPTLERSYKKSEMRDAILAAMQRFRWMIVSDKKGKIIAEYRRGKIMAKIAVEYTPRSYEIKYVDSQNLKYNGKTIHKTYNGWIHNLEGEIDNNLKKLAQGEALAYAPSVTVAELAQETPSDTTTAGANSTIDSVDTTVTETQGEESPQYQCKATFNFTGSLRSGRVVTAKQSIAHISKEQAVVQAASVLSTEGFIVDTTSPNVGLVSAHEVKRKGVTLPINLMFSEDAHSGVVAKLTISVPGGTGFSVNAMKNYMCDNVMGRIKSTGYVKKERVVKAVETTSKAPKDDVPTRLKKLRKLYDAKLITKEEYDTKRAKILDEL